MLPLPQEFIAYTSALFGAERWAKYEQALTQKAAVSVRFNPWKCTGKMGILECPKRVH